jgi:hypothetical protein
LFPVYCLSDAAVNVLDQEEEKKKDFPRIKKNHETQKQPMEFSRVCHTLMEARVMCQGNGYIVYLLRVL